VEKVRFVDLDAQYKAVKPAVQKAVAGVLRDGQFILGPRVESFEKKFAAFVGVKHAVGVATGLEALRLPLEVLKLEPGDEVVVPASTYIATALAVSHAGGKVVLADCDPGTYNLDPEAFRRAITPRTRAVIAVHLAGQAADMDAIGAIAREKGIAVIEDAAQAAGARFKGKRCGSLGWAAAFSFYPGKNLGAYGDGGMVTTDDGALAARLRRMRNYGQDVKYVHLERGWNARLDAVQAAILEAKLPRLDKWNAARAKHAALYRKKLSGVGDLSFQTVDPRAAHVYHLFCVETEWRDELAAHLDERGVETVIHYPTPIHLQKAYADLGRSAGSFPNAERRCRRTVSLPMFAELTDRQISRVVAAVEEFFAR
jgi:dTDP-4-amino-4,6-dideoxygalactose transaminase